MGEPGIAPDECRYVYMQRYDTLSLKSRYQKTNATTKSERVAEGEAILASIFGEVAVAA